MREPSLREAVAARESGEMRVQQVIVDTMREIADDRCLGLAAQLAFYFLLALFPAILFLVALIGSLPIKGAVDQLMVALAPVAPADLLDIVRFEVDRVMHGQHESLITIGVAGALWSSSAAMVAIIDALNQAYDVTEWRPWWRRRFVAIALTLALAVFLSVAFTSILVGPAMIEWLEAWRGPAPALSAAWQILRWPLIAACAILGIDLVYHFAPNRPARWRWITPGAVVSTMLWIASSFGFKYYLQNVADYGATYGAIGGAIATMIWFYVSGLAILVGAELNGVLEQQSLARHPTLSQESQDVAKSDGTEHSRRVFTADHRQ